MYAWSKLVAFIAAAIGFAISFSLLQQFIGIASPWLGVPLMFYLLALAKLAAPSFVFRLPRGLYPLRPREQRSNFYQALGVPAFGGLLRRTPLRQLNTAVYIGSGKADLSSIVRRAQSAEAAHFWAAVLFAPYIAYAILLGSASKATLFIVIQLVVNIYPIMHLRLVRVRLGRTILRKSTRRHVTCLA